MKAALVASVLATTLIMVGCAGGTGSDDTSSSTAADSTANVVYPQAGADMFPMINAVVEQKSPSGLDVKLYDLKVARGSGWGDRLFLGVFQAGVEQLFPLDQTVDQTPAIAFTADPNQVLLTTDSYSASFEVNGANGTLTVEGVDTLIAAHQPEVGDLTGIGGETSIQVDAATTAHLFTMNDSSLLLSLFNGGAGASFPLRINLDTLDKVAPSAQGKGLTFTGTMANGLLPEAVSYDVQINGDGAITSVTVTKQ